MRPIFAFWDKFRRLFVSKGGEGLRMRPIFAFWDKFRRFFVSKGKGGFDSPHT